MKDNKAAQLRNYQLFATSLLLLMVLIYIGTHMLAISWQGVGYVRAFSEAAMIGALADWFAVVALFRHPLGIPIPHTNIIENSKSRIGANLGQFVTDNFLTAAIIRPRLEQLHVAARLGGWLELSKNRDIIIQSLCGMVKDAVGQMDDAAMQRIIGRQVSGLMDKIAWNQLAGSALGSIVAQGMHEEWISMMAKGIGGFIRENAAMVKEKVKEESHFLIPGFVDNMIAGKITKGAITYFHELAVQTEHPQRKIITGKLKDFAESLKREEKWARDLAALQQSLLSEQHLHEYAGMLWQYLKQQLMQDLNHKESAIQAYLDKTIRDMGMSLMTEEDRQQQIDRFIRVQAFKLIMRHRHEVANLISQTVGNWKGRDLSDKLELEVGKDLQFIRVNGTLVGGLVGLLIYIVTQALKG